MGVTGAGHGCGQVKMTKIRLVSKDAGDSIARPTQDQVLGDSIIICENSYLAINKPAILGVRVYFLSVKVKGDMACSLQLIWRLQYKLLQSSCTYHSLCMSNIYAKYLKAGVLD